MQKMQALPNWSPEPPADVVPIPSVPSHPVMDREFIARNQIVERYLSGRLPLRGTQDFERYCREHPTALDEIGLSQQISSALRLMEAGGIAPPWEIPAKPWWERLPVLLGAATLALLLAVTVLVLAGKLAARAHTIISLQQRLALQALEPVTSTRQITLVPSRTLSTHSAATIGGGAAEMADLKIDMSWSPFSSYRVTIDRLDQGRVAVLHNVLRDSNGHLHIGLNSSALGPGIYQLTIEGMNWRGDTVTQAWTTITVAR
jgi:hypothetical protein